jgi:hypothetical protein
MSNRSNDKEKGRGRGRGTGRGGKFTGNKLPPHLEEKKRLVVLTNAAPTNVCACGGGGGDGRGFVYKALLTSPFFRPEIYITLESTNNWVWTIVLN